MRVHAVWALFGCILVQNCIKHCIQVVDQNLEGVLVAPQPGSATAFTEVSQKITYMYLWTYDTEYMHNSLNNSKKPVGYGRFESCIGCDFGTNTKNNWFMLVINTYNHVCNKINCYILSTTKYMRKYILFFHFLNFEVWLDDPLMIPINNKTVLFNEHYIGNTKYSSKHAVRWHSETLSPWKL